MTEKRKVYRVEDGMDRREILYTTYQMQPEAVRELYSAMRAYVPTAFLSAFMAVPHPEESDEILFICEKE